MRTKLINILSVGALAGCSPQHPVVVAPQQQGSVVACSETVRIEAASKLWTGAPADFESYLTPFAVDIDNLGSQSVRIDVADFYLEDDQGRIAAALRPNGIAEEWLAKPPAHQTTEEQHVASWQRDDLDRALTGMGDKPSAVRLPDRLRSGASPMLGGKAVQLPHWGWSWSVNRDWDEEAKGVVLPGMFRVRALRTAELGPGERGIGFVYFPRVTEDMRWVTVHWRPADGQPVSLKFKVNG